MDNATAGLKTQAKAFGQPLSVRCVAGERSWLQVHAARHPTTCVRLTALLRGCPA